jgi:hypothetical protein
MAICGMRSIMARFCMELVRLTVVFAYVPVHGTTQSRTFGAASFYIFKTCGSSRSVRLKAMPFETMALL